MLSGFIPVDKPAGPTSHDVVDEARRRLGTREIGHAGTLDPPATGLLLLAVGRATALLQFMEFDKGYRAVVRLGATTDTLDAAGEVLETRAVTCSPEDAAAAVRALRGKRKQRPPMVSAVKVGGKRLHELAREGKEVERAERDVEVTRVEVVRVALPDLEFDVDVSSGTYVRVLAEDLGRALGCGAHLLTLRRTRVGPFRVEDAVGLDGIAAARLLPPSVGVAHLPGRELTPAELAGVKNGRPVTWEGKGLVRLVADGKIFAVSEGNGGWAKSRRVYPEGL
ncbi:MAG: tRNA pseudouridine(55) synthase TruB [Planctomycetes bacterium]|nr:tRNA pseudouridine(55) synthase TruB [Planctomycetota bacterium]